jgi:thioredoxin-like negative regulator of GroEL
VRRIEVKSRLLVVRDCRQPLHYHPKVTRLGPFLAVVGLVACAPSAPRTVPRVVDGRVEQGPVVSPYAYEWFIKGELSAAKGEHEEAAIAFENAMAAPTADDSLMARLAEEYERSGASRRADRTLALAHRSYRDSPRVALAEARVLQNRGDDERAISSLVRAHRLAPSWEEPVMALAEMLGARGHPYRANAILLEHIAMAPEHGAVGARRLLVETARRTGDAETLDRALALEAGISSAARTQAAGRLALDAGRPALAARMLAGQTASAENERLWLRALIESGDKGQAGAFAASSKGKRLGDTPERAQLLIASGDARRALGLLKTARPVPSARYAKGRALLAQGDYLDAAAALADVPLGAADFEKAMLLLADCAMSQRRLGAAAESLNRVPHDSLQTREKLAEIYVRAGDLRSGLRLFEPKLSSERAVLASLFEQAGRFEEAAAFYATVQLRSAGPARLRARVTSEQLASRGLIQGAIVILKTWTAFAPEDLYARVRLVELLQNDGRIEAARKEGRHALELITDPLLRAHLGDLLAGMPSEEVPLNAGTESGAGVVAERWR